MEIIINKLSTSVYYLCIVFCLLLSQFASTHAQSSGKTELKDGMTQAEVLDEWGAPQEKIVYETKREEVWLYEGRQVVFNRGKLKQWRSKEQELKIEKEKKALEAKKNKAAEEDSDPVVEEILDELLKQTSKDSGLKK